MSFYVFNFSLSNQQINLIEESKLIKEDIFIKKEFKLIKGKSISYEILKEFDLIDFTNLTFKDYIKLISDEIESLSIYFERVNIYKTKWIEKINPDNFFYVILKMYTDESFLFQIINNLLRSNKVGDFNMIKYYYNAMLSSFQYCSKKTNKKIKKSKYDKITLYRGSKILSEELSIYKTSQNKIKVVKEFLSTSMDMDKALTFVQDDLKPGMNSCLYHIEISYSDRDSDYAFLDENFSQFPDEKEVIIRSGSVMLVRKITEEKNLLHIYVTLLSFSWKGFFTFLKYDNKMNSIDLSESNMTKNNETMKFFVEALQQNNKLKLINLNNNDLGQNTESMIYLSHAIQINKNLSHLYLKSNYLGLEAYRFKYLADALKINQNLILIDLSKNNLAELFSDSIKYLAEALIANTKIVSINLSENNLGLYSISLEYLSKIIEGNNFIIDLNLSLNGIGAYFPDALKILLDSIKNNKALINLDLSKNKLSHNDESFKYFSDIIYKNKSLSKILLNENGLENLKPKIIKNVVDSFLKNKNLNFTNLDNIIEKSKSSIDLNDSKISNSISFT